MSNLFSGISGRFRGTQRPSQVPTLQTSSSVGNLAPRAPQISTSPSMPTNLSANNMTPSSLNDPLAAYNLPNPKPLWLNAAHAKHIVKGNFMTLSTKPKTLEQGEWIAHQVVEHYRNLWLFVRIIHEKDEHGDSICSDKSCPRMSAGPNHTFTWLNARREPVEVPAPEYIGLMQRWITGKIENTDIFPNDPSSVSFSYNPGGPAAPSSGTYPSGSSPAGTPIAAGPTNSNLPISALSGNDWIGKSSGFPQEFFEVCQAIFRQMFRVYAHLYWAHFVEPFYDLNLEKQLNSCFSHFILTTTALDMMKPHELEPMQPLIDLWAANGTFPEGSKAHSCANAEAGKYLLALSERQQN